MNMRASLSFAIERSPVFEGGTLQVRVALDALA